MSDERIKMLELAMNDKEFAKKVADIESEAALKNLFATKDIIMTDDEISAFCKQVRSVLNENAGEFSEDALEDVTGGSILGGLIFVGGCYVAGVIYGHVSKKKIGEGLGWC